MGKTKVINKELFEIDSDFNGVRYEIKKGCIVVKAGECGVLSIDINNVKAFANELENIATIFRRKAR